MLIIGAKGHAKEILDIFFENEPRSEILFYDDVSVNMPDKLFGIYKILKNDSELENFIKRDNRFILGTGNPIVRFKLYKKFLKMGLHPFSLISKDASIGKFGVRLGDALNIMRRVVLTNDIQIGKGTLINASCTIHHDTVIGDFCEISPGVHITGSCCIGNFSSIGTGAVILPNRRIGKNVKVGAGALVNKDIPDNSTAIGIPAKVIKIEESLNEYLW